MSGGFTWAVAVVPQRGAGQDRAAVVRVAEGVVIALADGAGGTGHGAVAAQAVIEAVTQGAPAGRAWWELLEALDRDGARLGHGQTTAVVLSVTPRAIMGASVGDSGAWVVRGAQIEDLTEGQTRKPLVGAGCRPFAVHAAGLGAGTLLVASDGLLRYAKPADIARLAAGPDLDAAARGLVELVRLRSGALPDDVAVVLCREVAP
jgi:serine/threonine protein phosphatase PrpC